MAEGEGAQSGAEGTQSGTEDTTGTGSTGSTGSDGTQSGTNQGKDSTDSSAANEWEDKLKQQQARTQAADKRAAEAEAKLKQLLDKDLPEVEKLKRDYSDAQKQVESLTETNRNLALQVAFLTDNTYSWHNPERALKLVNLEGVEIDADGRVTGLKDALKALAASDPYLIKSNGETDQGSRQGSTPPGNNGNAGGGKPDRKALAKRFPVMATRTRSS